MKLQPESLVVDSFDLSEAVPPLGVANLADDGARSRYCSLIETCATCYTDCPCA
jgi:hypothetical protein